MDERRASPLGALPKAANDATSEKSMQSMTPATVIVRELWTKSMEGS